ncbi:hypothetical protein RDI58_001324 [Solanum bulbocastanum]|uniref:Endonuclease/exonuclease/phosphatase domain-containing protein n=1 Tax=Solanum bulbocastanum TaxID=147425 RepID=A0AAN8UBP9_SOLBU
MIVTWNVRSFNQKVKHKELRLFIKRNKVNLIAIYEHRVRDDRASIIIKKNMAGWNWCTHESNNVRGRIWVIWNPNEVTFTRKEDAVQYIHGLIMIKQSNIQFQFTAVYGLHTIATRLPLWTAIKQLNNNINEPWLIMGDFNSILTQRDRPGGSPVQDIEIRDFRECLLDCNLAELQIEGREYTWTNGHVYSQIDKAIANAAWMDIMPTQVMAIEPLFSDHSPLGLIVEDKGTIRKDHFVSTIV